MGRVCELVGQKVQHPALEAMDFHRVKWLDLENPSLEEVKRVAAVTHLPFHDLQALLDRDELPRIAEIGHFSVIVCKAPLEHNHGARVSATSLSFLVSDRLLITMHRDPVASISSLLEDGEGLLVSLLHAGTSEVFYHLYESIMNEFFSRLDDLEDQIDKIEDAVFAHPQQKTVKRIFSLKRTLIYFHKALSANRDVLVNLQKATAGAHLQDEVQHRLTHLYYDVVQLIDVVATYRDILTGTLDIYLSTVSNNMNAVMKKMAAYGTIVLVPTFITGLYGMNFRFMPELPWKYGYLFAWGLIVLSVVVLWQYFKRKDWF